MKKYYSLVESKKSADIYIYGDITSWEWYESDVSAYSLAKEIETIESESINVYINSYGGEVAEGLAIYNALKRHKAEVATYCDGFACSAASIVFMAGKERVMNNSSLLFIHNAWTYANGDSNALKKQAEDLEKITSASVNAYMEHINIGETELKEKMDVETWITPEEALEMNFATKVLKAESVGVSQSVKEKVIQKLTEQMPKSVLSQEQMVELKAEMKEIAKSVVQETSSKELAKEIKPKQEKTFLQRFTDALKAEKE